MSLCKLSMNARRPSDVLMKPRQNTTMPRRNWQMHEASCLLLRIASLSKQWKEYTDYDSEGGHPGQQRAAMGARP